MEGVSRSSIPPWEYGRHIDVKSWETEFPVAWNPEKKKRFSIVCKFFKNGCCFKGDDCKYSHDFKDEPCRFLLLFGSCSEGSKCKYYHGYLDDGQRKFWLEYNAQNKKEIDIVDKGSEDDPHKGFERNLDIDNESEELEGDDGLVEERHDIFIKEDVNK